LYVKRFYFIMYRKRNVKRNIHKIAKTILHLFSLFTIALVQMSRNTKFKDRSQVLSLLYYCTFYKDLFYIKNNRWTGNNYTSHFQFTWSRHVLSFKIEVGQCREIFTYCEKVLAMACTWVKFIATYNFQYVSLCLFFP